MKCRGWQDSVARRKGYSYLMRAQHSRGASRLGLEETSKADWGSCAVEILGVPSLGQALSSGQHTCQAVRGVRAQFP